MGGLHSGETGPVRDADGAGLPAGDGDVAVHLADSRQRDRLGDAGRRRRRARPQRRLVLSRPGDGAAAAPAAPTRRGRGGSAPAAARGGGGGGGALPYWGKYVYHDNNRDINLSQVQMRAITDWYFTAHPPIMHDLHESLSLLYTYSGGAPQNPNLDPLLFAELPFFANWELAQMTKWGMPGVYTHAFMDGWSPGYLGSVAYNHNGMMQMYETQSGRDRRDPAPAAGGRGAAVARRRARRRGARWRGAAAVPARGGGAGAARGAVRRAARRRWRGAAAPARRRRRRGAPPAAGARRRRRRRRRTRRRADGPRRRPGSRVVSRHSGAAGRAGELHAPQQHELHADRRALGAAAHVDVPEPRARELLHEDAQLDRSRAERARRTAT